MSAKAIVSTPDTLEGRWRFEDTRLPIAMFKSASHEFLLENWPYLTREDIDAAKAFEMTPQSDAPIVTRHGDEIGMRCRCGEWMPPWQIEENDDIPFQWRCVGCDRVYRLTITAEEVTP
jgi:uncharacterized protein (DUF433 family)